MFFGETKAEPKLKYIIAVTCDALSTRHGGGIAAVYEEALKDLAKRDDVQLCLLKEPTDRRTDICLMGKSIAYSTVNLTGKVTATSLVAALTTHHKGLAAHHSVPAANVHLFDCADASRAARKQGFTSHKVDSIKGLNSTLLELAASMPRATRRSALETDTLLATDAGKTEQSCCIIA